MLSLYLSATRKSSGKTMLAIGLCRALADKAWKVQPFKKGPDYIDPMWLGRASARPCINLDFNTMGQEELLQRFSQYGKGADISIIEGNKGLYDGLDLLGSDSNAALCELLQTPVILIVDARGMTRGVAPMMMGYQQFDPRMRFAGVVFNRTGGTRHEEKLRQVTEHYTDFNILGCVPNLHEEIVAERHLGLMTDQEVPAADDYIFRLGKLVSQNVDVDALVDIRSNDQDQGVVVSGKFDLAYSKEQTTHVTQYHRRLSSLQSRLAGMPITIGIARDSAFCFYYQDDLDAMVEVGAKVVEFDTLNDGSLPDVDALFIGGGFPETNAEALQANTAMREAVYEFARSGKPIYGECGGLMYLSRKICWEDEEFEMVGLLPGDTVMHSRPIGRGYVKLAKDEHYPWPGEGGDISGGPIHAHEFHYSSFENADSDLRYGYKTLRGHGVDGKRDGLVLDHVFASYAHMRHSYHHPWVFDFIDKIYNLKLRSEAAPPQSIAYH